MKDGGQGKIRYDGGLRKCLLAREGIGVKDGGEGQNKVRWWIKEVFASERGNRGGGVEGNGAGNSGGWSSSGEVVVQFKVR